MWGVDEETTTSFHLYTKIFNYCVDLFNEMIKMIYLNKTNHTPSSKVERNNNF